jgi:hypothetical protein
MLNPTVLALVLALPVDAQAAPAVARDAARASWTQDWAVSLLAGRSFYDSRPNTTDETGFWHASHRHSELRVTHQGTPFVLGVALHRIAFPTSLGAYAIGAGMVLGARHAFGSWSHAELDVTLGLERSHYLVGPPMTNHPAPDAADTYPYGGGDRSGSLALYTRLGAGIALHVAAWLDVPVRLILHRPAMGEGHTLAAVSLGVRCLLP